MVESESQFIRRRQKLGRFVAAAILALGFLGSLLTLRREQAAANNRDDRSASLAAEALNDSVNRLVSSLRGGDGLVADGAVSAAEFKAFAQDVLNGAPYSALAREAVVLQADRDAFEAATKLTIRDTDGQGGFVRAADRPQHLVVVDVVPATESSSRLLGFDISSDPVRLAASEASATTDGPVLSAPISLAGSADRGVFVIHRLRTPDGTLVGFVSSGVAIETLLEAPHRQLPVGARLHLFDGAAPLTSEPVVTGRSRAVPAAGREWRIVVEDPDGVHYRSAAVIGLATVVLALVSLWSNRREEQFGNERNRKAYQSEQIATLGSQLAAASDFETIADVFTSSAGQIAGADYVDVALLDRRAATLGIVRSPSPKSPSPKSPSPKRAQQPLGSIELDTDAARAQCALSGAPLHVTRDDAADFPGLDEELDRAGVNSLLYWPLLGQSRTAIGVAGFGWDTTIRLASHDRAIVGTLAELVARTVERAVLTDVERRRSEALRELAQELARAATREAVGEAVGKFAAPVVDAECAYLQLPDTVEVAGEIRTTGTSSSQIPLRRADQSTLGALHVTWGDQRAINVTIGATLATMADLISQSFERADLYETEHNVIADLQARLLTPLPRSVGIEHAARYQPAERAVGIGGDWYNGVALQDGTFVLVIGDVTGHGTTAVAAMAQLRNVLTGLIRIGTPLGSLFSTAQEMVNAEDSSEQTFATAQVLHFVPDTGTVGCLSAGHPPALLRTPDGGVQQLDHARQALIGVQLTPQPLVYVPFPPGSFLLAYTDGLIEQRREPITTAIERLGHLLVETRPGRPLQATLTSLIRRAREPVGSFAPTDDDYAVVLLRPTATPPRDTDMSI